jgi:ABC-type Fe3+-hydroxamate transport system substrate-binding protein
MGAAADLVGVTRYCTRPREVLKGARRVGGTKNPDLEAIRAAKPDLVFCNAEENRPEDVERLRSEFRVDVSHPRTVAEIPALLRRFGELAGRKEEAEKISLRVESELERVEAETARRADGYGGGFRFVYLIWKDPLMTVGPRTYVADLLRRAGGSPALADPSGPDYPVTSEHAILHARPDVLILPDEPYPFSEKDAKTWRGRLPAATRVFCVPGDDFCWHGARTLEGLAAADLLARRVAASAA